MSCAAHLPGASGIQDVKVMVLDLCLSSFHEDEDVELMVPRESFDSIQGT